MIKPVPTRQVSKSKLSMYLRTLCDRELYLSLFSNNPKDLIAAGIPVPLKSRPGVQIITSSGTAFEHEQFDMLVSALPNNVYHANNGKDDVDLAKALGAVSKPTLILQPSFSPEEFRGFALQNLGVAKSDLPRVPPLTGLRPDVIFVDERLEKEHEILADGTRRQLDASDKRMALRVIDLKNVTEANASYSAEVCLYAFFLSNWLQTEGGDLEKKFFVSDRVYLWRHVEMPQFTKIKTSKEGADHTKRLAALHADLTDGLVSFLIYMPSVRKFFVEDLPRVIKTGDSNGWGAVEFHVNARCSSCDWLGNRTWLSTDDQKFFDAHPEHYCSRNAETGDHLCKLATLSKGAATILGAGGHPKVASLAGIDQNAQVLRSHSLLKKDRKQISARAESIIQNATSVDKHAKIGGLAKRLNAEYDIIVNFDAGSGFLTGIALRGILFAPYAKTFPAEAGQPGQGFKALGEEAFVINKDNLAAEWAALSAFIEKLGGWIEETGALFAKQQFGAVRTQICFWELRQYEELCNAFGRHLLDILSLPLRSQRALAWIFPAEELMEKSDSICPSIVFLRDIVTASVRLPQRFATTLLGTAQHYHHTRLTPRVIDSYYVEPLGNGIPRERIFEIWKSPTGTVRMFGRIVSVVDAIMRYGNVLKAHAWATASIAARLRDDLKDCIEGDAPALNMSIPAGLTGVPFDSKLWDRWSQVSAAVARTEGMNALITRAEWLEASYKAIILNKLVKDLGGYRYEFEVSDDSTEAKIEEDAYCTVGIVAWPGFPLQRAASLGLAVGDSSQYVAMHKVILARIEQFDRASKRIIVRLQARWKGVSGAFNAVMKSGLIPIGTGELYLLESLPYDDSDSVTELLTAIGDPPVATTAKETLVALGVSAAKKIKKGAGANSPPAAVLWQADQLTKAVVRTDVEVSALTTFAKTANKHSLNSSQSDAVAACAKHQLSVIWGPPGTGKTETLIAFLHAVVREGKCRNILITGPNYRAVEELSGRLAENLDGDPKAGCDFFWLYSRSREPKAPPATGVHLVLKAARQSDDCAEYTQLLQSLDNAKRVTIVSTTAHIVDQLTEAKTGSVLGEVFDLVILDESSQIPITLALKPLAAQRNGAQLVVAGDHKQMPPIQNLDPPQGAEYLVSSIQAYLIKRFSVPQQPLLINYRSNQDLVEYAKSLDYPRELKAFNAQKDLLELFPVKAALKHLPNGLPNTIAYHELLRPERRVAALIHADPTSSQANELEAGLVAGLAFAIRHSMAQELNTGTGLKGTAFTDDAFFGHGIGIVTPHKAQKALVLRKLRSLFPKANAELIFSAVDTVERFQGGERNTIIVSYGVGDTDIIEGEEEFLLQLERTNVAVSRARAKCIVLMPKSLAYHLPTDQKAAVTSFALKSYLEEFCRQRLELTIEFNGEVRIAEARWH